jgi:hypothetical protein
VRGNELWKLLVAVNGYIVNREPWKKFKEAGADESLSLILWNTLEVQRIVWVMMAPFMPATTREALSRLGADPDRIDADALKWGALPTARRCVRPRQSFRASMPRRTSVEDRWKTNPKRLNWQTGDLQLKRRKLLLPTSRRSASTNSWKSTSASPKSGRRSACPNRRS